MHFISPSVTEEAFLCCYILFSFRSVIFWKSHFRRSVCGPELHRQIHFPYILLDAEILSRALFSCKDYHWIHENGLPHPSHLLLFIFLPSSPAYHPWHRCTMYLHIFLHIRWLLFWFWLFGVFGFGFLGHVKEWRGRSLGFLGFFPLPLNADYIPIWLLQKFVLNWATFSVMDSVMNIF